MPQCEKCNRTYKNDWIYDEKGEFNTHKTVKPLAICEYIIALTTFSKDSIVLDPFIGSGTTAVAAKRLGRKFIGIDINQEYIEIAQKRLEIAEIKDRLDTATYNLQQLTLLDTYKNVQY
ncbi:MAG TPA: site-specific DNA-methyltransferase [Candidatus Hydrogenedens sp.]|nr:site-specific DNA-methyltransferase [Candidatus Hydrogenedens sp.]